MWNEELGMRNEELRGSFASEYHKLRYSVDIRETYNNGVAPQF